MTGPLMILALLSIFGGFIPTPKFLEPVFGPGEIVAEPWMMIVASGVGLIGIGLAYLFYVAKPGLADSIAKSLGGLYKLVYNKYFVDEVYDATVVKPIVNGSRTVLWRGVDVGVIDGVVNGIGGRSKGVGALLRLLQGGNIRAYAAWIVFGSVLVLIFIGLGGAR
jgi:NADH-quinone oxidoreductase subunit L